MSLLSPKHARDPRKKKRTALYAGAVIFLVLLLVFGWAFPSFFGGGLREAGRPLWRVRESVKESTGTVFSSFLLRHRLAGENRRLKRQVQLLEQQLLDFTVLQEEHERLRALVGREEEDDIVLATVLVRPPQSPYDTLIIDAGSALGIAHDARVRAGERVLIGRVEQVSENTSRVRLLSAPGEETAVFIGEERLPATAAGQGGNNFEIVLPRDSGVQEGERVVVAGTDALLLGTVGHLEVLGTDSFQRALVVGAVNIHEVAEVIVEI